MLVLGKLKIEKIGVYYVSLTSSRADEKGYIFGPPTKALNQLDLFQTWALLNLYWGGTRTPPESPFHHQKIAKITISPSKNSLNHHHQDPLDITNHQAKNFKSPLKNTP